MKFNLNEAGFSLAEVMVAAGLVGVVSLGVMHLTNNIHRGQATAETKMEEIEIRRIITSTLSDSLACLNTLNGIEIGSNFNTIRNSANTPIFQVNNVYGNRALKLISMRTVDKNVTYADGTRGVDIVVQLAKMKQLAMGADNLRFSIDLRVTAENETAPITACFVNNDQIVQQACEALGGTWIDGSCQLPSCPQGQLLQGIDISGNPICRIPNCDEGYAFRGFNGSGDPLCERLNVYQ
jgi:hypothetical protein